MKKVTVSFEISEEAFELLKKIGEKVYVEYRDNRVDTIEKFLESDDFKNKHITLESYKNRNFGGTLKLAYELAERDLIEDCEGAWHMSYQISEFGKETLKKLG